MCALCVFIHAIEGHRHTFRVLEKKLTNSGPFRKSTSKHSIYPPAGLHVPAWHRILGPCPSALGASLPMTRILTGRYRRCNRPAGHRSPPTRSAVPAARAPGCSP